MVRVNGARILVERIDDPIESSIIEVVRLEERPSQYAKVMAVGSGRRKKDGTRLPMDLKGGETVLTVPYCGTPITLDGRDLFLIEEADVLAVVEC